MKNLPIIKLRRSFMDLKCKKLNCKYNNACACMSKGIRIERNCECGTFEKNICFSSDSNNADEFQYGDHGSGKSFAGADRCIYNRI